MGVVAFVLGNCAMREDRTLVTAPSVKTLRSVLGFIEELFPETLESAKLEFSGYLEFLDESDEFSGSDQLFEGLYDLVNDIDADEFGALDSLAGPIPSWAGQGPVATQPPTPEKAPAATVIFSSSLGEPEALAALEQLPLAARARAFLAWIGKGKSITSTGALRRKDIRAAAAVLGEDAVGVSGGSTPGDWTDDVAGFRLVMSMSGAPVLDLYWQMLNYAELIEVSGGRMVVSKSGAEFLAGTGQKSAGTVLVLAAFGYTVLAGLLPRSNGLRDYTGDDCAAVLIAGATDKPMLAEDVIEERVPERYVSRSYPSPDVPWLGKRVARWGEMGLVDIGETITVPEPLLKALATALSTEFKLEVGGPRPQTTGSAAPGLPSVHNPQGPAPVNASTSGHGAERETVYRLKIELDGSMPPVWRQVEVPAEIDLGELNWLIQSCFRWDNRHPHLFEAGRPGSGFHRIYRDGNDDRDSGLPAAIQCDEATEILGDVLKNNRKTLRYVYDFDDNWQHTITLESAFPDTDWSGKVRCIDGEGRAPEEDTGGIWGWMDVLDAAFAPEHPMHQEYCDLLGIDSGDHLDVAVFTSEDRKRVNELLAKEFGD